MKRKISIFLLLVFAACQHSQQTEENLVLIQIQDRNGLSETISAEERLSNYSHTDFLASQPYKKVLRVYRKEGKNRSVITTYHPNGGICQLLEAKEMRAFGAFQEWFANGMKKIDATVIGGTADLAAGSKESWIFDGLSQVWDEEGHLIAAILYDKGVLSGTSTYYYPTGIIEKTIPYRHDQIEGDVHEFWEEGQLKTITPYRNGIKEGESLSFWPNETPSWKEGYEQGQLKEAIYWNISGDRISEVKGGSGFRAIFLKGKLSEMEEIRKGIPEGLVKTFSEIGELASIYHIKNGRKHGEEIEYFSRQETDREERLPKLLLYWDQDSIHGTAKTWYENGQLQSQRELCRNKYSGTSCSWYLDGSLMLIEEYEDDKLIRGKYYRKNQREPISTVSGGNGTAMIYDADGIFLRKVTYSKSKAIDPE